MRGFGTVCTGGGGRVRGVMTTYCFPDAPLSGFLCSDAGAVTALCLNLCRCGAGWLRVRDSGDAVG